MERLYIILRDFGYTGLKQFLLDVKLKGIEIVPYAVNGDSLSGEDPVKDQEKGAMIPAECKTGSYLVTDCMRGILFAREKGMGYVYYEEAGTDFRNGPVNPSKASDETGMDTTAVDATDAECIIQGFDELDADFITKMYQRHVHLPWTILRTERLTLREITPADVDRLYEIYAEPSVTLYTEDLFENREDELAYTESYIKNQYGFFGYGLWIVEETDTGRVVGRAGISNREGYDEAELGYVIEKERQNRGYATEVCRAIVEYARSVLMMSGLNCFVRQENVPSIRLCRRLGFEHLEDTEINGILMNRYHMDL
ncbi:MAG: GNAT family N-acetyltransferase [Lachnospiraceae bacterium]|nr:GNAT family N-acetyltransferase [Lachnospiraceae bacterium]